MLISLMIPSRNRPNQLRRLVESVGKHANVEIIVRFDDDDFATVDLLKQLDVESIVGNRMGNIAREFNRMASAARGTYAWALNDDVVIVHDTWLESIKQANPFIYGRTACSKPGEPLGMTYEFPIIHLDHVRQRGWFFNPIYSGYGPDRVAWEMYGDRPGAVDLPGVVLCHHQEKDETHRHFESLNNEREADRQLKAERDAEMRKTVTP